MGEPRVEVFIIPPEELPERKSSSKEKEGGQKQDRKHTERKERKKSIENDGTQPI
jgi:ribosomal protein S3